MGDTALRPAATRGMEFDTACGRTVLPKHELDERLTRGELRSSSGYQRRGGLAKHRSQCYHVQDKGRCDSSRRPSIESD